MDFVKGFLTKLDIFGEPLSFKYNKKEKYSTPLGGFFVILFVIVSLYLGIYNLVGFIGRNNFSIVYYTMNIPVTEKIIFKDSKAAFAFGFDCTSNGRFKVQDVLNIEVRFVIYSKTMQGEYVKNKNLLSTHLCGYEDFYNLYNKQFDYLSLPKYSCLDDNDVVIEGFWDDQVFSYYEISVVSKNQTEENLDNIDEYLFENDCKLQFFYTDITMDLYNYKEPTTPYLNSKFIQLNPTLFIKRNIYFMNQYLTDDDYYFGVIQNYDNKVLAKTLFSWYEEYYLYLGLDRKNTKPLNTYDYAKIYVRADNKKTDIRRNYQKLMEFYANATSLLIGIFRILIIIFAFINGFYMENSITKRIFFLKEFEDNNNFDIFKKRKQIKELKSLSDISSIDYSNLSSFETNIKDIISDKNNLTDNELKTYNIGRQNHIDFQNKVKRNSFSFIKDKKDNMHRKLEYIKSKDDLKSETSFELEDRKDNLDLIKIKKFAQKNNDNNDPKQRFIYFFNVIEIIISSFFECCMSKRLAMKNNINLKAKDILYNKLDIVTYIRNMFLIDIMNDTLFNESKIDIINFLSRPLLSINKNENYDSPEFYQNYNENDFNKFYARISELLQKTKKKEKEKNLILLVNKSLREFL